MTRLVGAVAIVLTLAVSGVPLVADWCALSCEAAQSSTETAVPACHHAGSSTARIGQVPAPCGHDHHPVVADAAIAATAAQVTPALSGTATHLVAPASSLSAASARLVVAAPSPPLQLRLASPLRI